MTDGSFPRDLIERLDGWVHQLAAPLLPPRVVKEGDRYIRLEFRHHIPHAVMVGKLVRAVSGIRAAFALAEAGHVAECASILRIVSDFCTEVSAIGEALNRGGEPPRAVRDFVTQYFTPKARTPEEYAASERARYVSRNELMKAETRMAEGTDVDGEKIRVVHDFLNMSYDAYVHGAYETTMELLDPMTGQFAMRGHPDNSKRREFVEAAFLKAHEVIVAIERRPQSPEMLPSSMRPGKPDTRWMPRSRGDAAPQMARPNELRILVARSRDKILGWTESGHRGWVLGV